MQLKGVEVPERAGLALSIIAGVWLMRKVIGDAALVRADDEALARRLEGVFDLLFEDDGDDDAGGA